MGRLLVALDDSVAVSPAELADVWTGDAEARAVGVASVEAAAPGDFFSGLELVVIPLLVNLASSAITGLIGRLIAKTHPDQARQDELEIIETTGAGGDRVVVVRLRGAYQ